jgi:hypothetical protein
MVSLQLWPSAYGIKYLKVRVTGWAFEKIAQNVAQTFFVKNYLIYN